MAPTWNWYARLSQVATAITLTVVAGACSGNGIPPAGGDPDNGTPGGGADGAVSFAADIQPIFTTNCAGCHSPGGIADLSGIPTRLREGEAFDMIVNVASVQNPDLVLVVPGNAQASLLFQKVSSDSPPVGARMPLFAPVLTHDEILLIRDWIDQGAHDN